MEALQEDVADDLMDQLRKGLAGYLLTRRDTTLKPDADLMERFPLEKLMDYIPGGKMTPDIWAQVAEELLPGAVKFEKGPNVGVVDRWTKEIEGRKGMNEPAARTMAMQVRKALNRVEFPDRQEPGQLVVRNWQLMRGYAEGRVPEEGRSEIIRDRY
jgi:hypothetical protein